MTIQKGVAEKLFTKQALFSLDQINLLPGRVAGKARFIVTIGKFYSFPYIRDYIKSEMCNLIFEKYPDADLLAGVATAGDLHGGAMAADQLKICLFIYVRPKT